MLYRAPVQAVVLQHVQHARHLAEDEHARVALLQLGQQLVQQHHLAAVLNQVLACEVGGTGLGTLRAMNASDCTWDLTHPDTLGNRLDLVATFASKTKAVG